MRQAPQQTPVAGAAAPAAAECCAPPTTTAAAAAAANTWTKAAQNAPAHLSELKSVCNILKTLDPDSPLPEPCVRNLIRALRRTRTPKSAMLTLLICEGIAIHSATQCQQVIDAGIISEVLRHVPHSLKPGGPPCGHRDGCMPRAWDTLVCMVCAQPAATVAALGGPTGASFSALLAEIPCAAVRGPAASKAAFEALELLARNSPEAATRIAGDAAALQAAVQQTDLHIMHSPNTSFSSGKIAGLSLLYQLLLDDQSSNPPEARALAAKAPGAAEVAMLVVLASSAQRPSNRTEEQTVNVRKALGVLASLLDINQAAADTVLRAAAVNDPARSDANIRLMLHLTSDPNPRLAAAAAYACYKLAKWPSGRAALLCQPPLAAALVAAIRRRPEGDNEKADKMRNNAAWIALHTFGPLLRSPGGKQLAAALRGMAPAVAAALLPRIADVCRDTIADVQEQGRDSQPECEPSEARDAVMVLHALLMAWVMALDAKAGRMSEAAAAAPRALAEVARYVALATTDGASDSSTGSDKNGGSSQDARAALHSAWKRLIAAAQCWTAAARRAARPAAAAGDQSLWDAAQVRALLAALQPAAAWLETNRDTGALKKRFAAVVVALSEMAGGEAPVEAEQMPEEAQPQQATRQPLEGPSSAANVVANASVVQTAEAGEAAPQQAVACATCGAVSAPGGGSLWKCKGCHLAKYCSLACHEAGWPAHERACKAAQRAAARWQQQE